MQVKTSVTSQFVPAVCQHREEVAWLPGCVGCGSSTVPGRAVPQHPCVTKQAVLRGECVFSAMEGARCCAEPQEPVLGCAGVQSCFSSQVVAGVGLAAGSVGSHSPFPMQGILSTHLLGKALVQTELCFLQLCSAAGKGLGLRVLVEDLGL